MARLGESAGHRAYIVDGDESHRAHCADQLATLGISTRSFASGTAFLEALPRLAPGGVLVDDVLLDMAGMVLIRRINGLSARFPAALMSGQSDLPTAIAAIQAGAVDLVQKPISEEALAACIENLQAHLMPEPEPLEPIESADERLARLTPRELAVLDGIVAGLPNKKIALQLGISPRTVETYRVRIKHKLQANSLPQLVKLALAARPAGASRPTPSRAAPATGHQASGHQAI
ncbi:DNA-binding response regulator [Aliidongia dinghuensis]|uniref:DNA-binding response regulator n=1 Tax=Aliidongia dinghuensis TaxID=1867774 RepID=A0A8J2YTL5_9PROT|nr:LuxR C-terminal-related transcriptional regulator [Aliidongia dinghuensis]GGF20018.1 DNA-binding response regulator [Aliidongia dinghuensis]